MKGLALTLAFVAASGQSHSHFVDPFDAYMDGVKARRPNAELVSFARECGVPVTSVRSKYALGGSNWEPVLDLPKALREQATDHVGILQVWHSGSRSFVLTWSYDLEQEYRSTYCFDETDKLKFSDTRAWIFELPSGKGWSYSRRWTMDRSGKLKASEGHFESMSGKPMSRPNMDPETAKEIDLQEDTHRIQDLKLPPAMLH